MKILMLIFGAKIQIMLLFTNGHWTVFENHQKSLIFNFVYRYDNNLSLDSEDSYVDFWRENSNAFALNQGEFILYMKTVQK